MRPKRIKPPRNPYVPLMKNGLFRSRIVPSKIEKLRKETEKRKNFTSEYRKNRFVEIGRFFKGLSISTNLNLSHSVLGSRN